MILQTRRAERSFRLIFAVLFVVSLNGSAGTTALNSLLPAIGRSSGIRDNLIVSISSLSAVLTFSLASFWGRQADAHGRRPIILLGLVGVVVSMTATGIAVIFGVHRVFGPMQAFAGMLVARALFGLFGTAYMPAVQSYVAVNTSTEERTNAMALLASANGIGNIIGPAVAPFLIFPFVTLGGPFFAFAVLALLTICVVIAMVPADDTRLSPGDKSAAKPKRHPSIWRDPAIRPFAIYGAVLSLASAANLQMLGFMIIDRLRLEPIKAQPLSGAAMMGGAIAVLVAQWGLIRVLRLRPPTLLLSGAMIAGLGNLALTASTSFPAILMSYAVINLGLGLARPGFTAGASLAAPPEKQSIVAGTISSLNPLGLIVGPIAALSLYKLSHLAPTLLIAAAMAGLCIYCLTSPGLRRTKQDYAAAAS